MNAKWLPISAAVFMALSSASAFAADDNGWEFHGYGRLGGQWDGDGASNMNTMGKPDYRTVTSNDENNNQVEIQAKKRFQVKGKVYSDFVTRAEYGNENANGESLLYSSEGSQHSPSNSGQFEVKEAYIEMGGFDFLGSDTKIWAGQRFLNRTQGLLSKEFWKQSSGTGAGVQVGQAGVALVSTDTDGQLRQADTENDNNKKNTMTSMDFYYYGVQGGPLGGSFDFDLKLMHAANLDQDDKTCSNATTGNYVSCADKGYGAAITYNRNYYGFKGWSQTGVAYGKGMAANRGVNFGSWSGGFGKDTDALFLTSYGVAELTKDLQLGTEVTYWAPNHLNWDSDLDVERFLLAAQPSYKINDNLRAIFTGSYSFETMKNNVTGGTAWWFGNGKDDKAQYYALEAALAFSVDSDYFGRPQIKPYISWVGADDKYYAGNIGIDDAQREKKSQTVFGVEAEVWF